CLSKWNVAAAHRAALRAFCRGWRATPCAPLGSLPAHARTLDKNCSKSGQNWPAGCSKRRHGCEYVYVFVGRNGDIKIQQHTEAQMRPTPEIAGVLFQK